MEKKKLIQEDKIHCIF